MFEIGRGWNGRIDPSGNGVRRHIHIFKDNKEFAQNDDGTIHEHLDNNLPKWLREKLNDMRKWKWKDATPAPSESAVPSSTPTISPRPQPTPYPLPAPAPAPAVVPAPRSKNKNVGEAGLGILGAGAGIGIIWLIIKVSAAPYPGGLSLVLL